MRIRRTTRALLAAGLGLTSCAIVRAEQDTLKSVAQKAVLNNPEVLQKWHAFQAAGNERDAAFGGYLPRVDLTVGAGREHRDDPLLRSDYSRNSTAVTLTQMLYDGFATREEVRRLDHARQVRFFEVLDASETAALEAARAYLDVLRYRKLVNFAEENYVRHRALFEQIQKKAQAGVARKVDLEQANGRLALAEANLLTETANLHDVSARFQRLVGAMPAKEMASPPVLTKGLPGDGPTLFKASLSRSPAVRAAIENVRAADAAVDFRRAAYQPRVDLKLRGEHGRDLNGYLGVTDNRSAEVVMTWNLFNGMSDVARSRQFADQRNVAKDLRDKTCRDVRQMVAIAYNDVRKLAEQLTYLDQHQLSTEKARDAYRKQFDIGQRTLLDLLDTENELFQAKRAYANADYDLLTAQVRTQAGFGNLLAALELSRVAKDEVPDPADWQAADDVAENCPPEGPMLYTVDKEALNARAAQFVRESQPQPGAGAPVPVTIGVDRGTEREVAESLKAWQQAWMKGDAAAYLDSYADSFAPAEGGSRKAWAAKRARIIGASRDIQLAIDDVRIAAGGADSATATFRQTYRSASYRDEVTKKLDWRRIGGKWQIVGETVGAPAK